jgi:RNA polymerase sigma factor (sigma-70 family)
VELVSGPNLPPFEDLLETTGGTVMRFLTVAVGSQHADDVYQETYLAALRAYPRCDDPRRLDRWVLRIASRKAIDHHRRAARAPLPTDRIPDAAVPPAEGTDAELWARVNDLPPKQRLAVVFRHVLDRPYDEIAAALGCSPDAARANVHAGMRRLRERVA